jgi:hypothetical protein
MHILQGLGPQDPASRFDHAQVTTSSYDHPYFGTLFLASILGAIGYPSSLNISSSITNPLHSIEMLYLVPRVLMGILAVVDTFLIYKIAERRYNRNIALIASILFAVMPLSWLIRRVYLDTILMPFLLSSILFALYNINSWSNSNSNSNNRKNRSLIPILLSGILLGLAIFTKIPAVTMIPLVGFLVYANNGRNFKVLGLWFIPVILIPLIWPAYSILAGQYDEWLNGVLWQGTQRQESTLQGNESHLILGSLRSIFMMDPVLVIFGMLGIVFATIKRDLFFLLWIIPFLILGHLIGWITYFHYILVLPAFCIAAANLIEDIPKRIIRTKGRTKQRLLSYIVISVIGIFGLISTSLLIITNFFPSQFAAAAFVVQTIQQNSNHSARENISTLDDNINKDATIISSPIYSWIFKYTFGNYQVFHTRDTHPIETQKIILMADSEYRYVLSKTEVEDARQIEKLQKIYNTTDIVATFRDSGDSYNFRNFPYTNIKECPLLDIEIRTR